MTERSSVADAVVADLNARGLVPTDGLAAEVTYVAMAKVVVLDADGKPATVYRHYDNCGENEDTYLALAHRLMWEAERHAGKG